jgi:hypothetical protein
MERPDPSIPAILWLCAAAVVHFSSYQGASTVADLGHGKLELRHFVAAVRDTVKAPGDTLEVTFLDPSAPESPETSEPPKPVPPPPPPEAKKPPPDKKAPEKKPDEKPPEKKPEEKKLDLLKPPTPTPTPPPPPPAPPPPDKRVAVQQHVDDKNQKDNPDAKHIADDANHVKDETQARITSHDQNDKNPSPGANAGPSREVGNADKTKVADSEDRPGSDKMPPGEKSPKNDPFVKSPKAPQAPNTSEAKPATAPPGQNGRSGPAEPARPAPTAPPPPTAPPQSPAASPETKDSPKGNYVINPFRSGETSPATSASAAPPAPTASAPLYSLPKLGGQPGPKGGVNFNLTPGAAIAAIGVETIKRERELDGERRKSAHRGNWKASPIDKWRASIENYVASVKPGNTTALNTARVPFATFLNHVHNRLHPIFADDFLWSLNDLPKDHPLNRKLSTSLEVVVDGEHGRIVRMGITKTSGVTAFDIAALDSMERASGGANRGFGKPPPAILSPDGNVYLHWEFHRMPEVACTTGNARPFILKDPPGGGGSPRTPPRAPEVPTERGKAGQAPGAKQGDSG